MTKFKEKKSILLPRWAWYLIGLFVLAGIGAILYGMVS